MLTGKTRSGFEYELDEKLKNDWRLTLAFADADSDDASRKLQGTVDTVRLLLGSREHALYEHVKEPDGRVPTDKLMEEVKEIIEAFGRTAKNS